MLRNFVKKNQKGAIVVLALVFGGIFLLLLNGLLGFILLQQRQSLQKAAWENSLHIAEAGMNYHRWVLNHHQEDIKKWWCGIPPVGEVSSCDCEGDICGPYEHTYYDPTGETEVGKFVLEIEARKMCDQVLGIYVTSTGSTKKYPNVERKVKAKFASTSVAEYAYLLNDSVWAGNDRNIYGKYHSNGGIRMNGIHNSLVTSARDTWIVGRSFGCCGDPCKWNTVGESCYCPDERIIYCGYPFYSNRCGHNCDESISLNSCSNYVYGENCNADSTCEWTDLGWKCSGVWGGREEEEEERKDLWQSPVPPFDFEGITADLAKIKSLAGSKGKYYPPTGDSGKGYHVTFNEKEGSEIGTFDIKIITRLGEVEAYDSEIGWHDSAEKIEDEYFPDPLGEYKDVALPAGCGLIYVEDDLWVDGTVQGKITLASADLISEDPPLDTTTFINWNLDYTALDDSDSLALITEKDVLIPLNSPEVMIIRGITVAQKGHFGRKHYSGDKKTELTMYGSVVSNGRVGTKWIYSDGSWASGYETRYNYFDGKLAKNPPPLLPYVSEELQFISWEEIR